MSTSTFLRVEHAGGVAVARVLVEKVASREAEILETELGSAAESASHRVAVDLSRVTLLSSIGIGALVNLHKRCKARGGAMSIFGLSEELSTMLKITSLDKIFKLAKDESSAIKAVSR